MRFYKRGKKEEKFSSWWPDFVNIKMGIPTYGNKVSWDDFKNTDLQNTEVILLILTDKLAGFAVHPVHWGYFEKWSKWPFQRYLCFAISGSCSCCKLFRCLSVAKAALLLVCFEGDGGTRDSLRYYYLFFIRLASLNFQYRRAGGLPYWSISFRSQCGDRQGRHWSWIL